jgi:isoleucyl-tRNA synthetase
MEKWGADVLRLWAASVEFVDDVRFGPNVIEQVGRVYRNIRNRIRFMLSNLNDLDPAAVAPREAMEPFDKLACDVVDSFVADVKSQYDRFEIHDAYLRIVEFESTMSSLYFDALKEPLYCKAENDRRRRSAQSALLYALQRFLAATNGASSMRRSTRQASTSRRGPVSLPFGTCCASFGQKSRRTKECAISRLGRG